MLRLKNYQSPFRAVLLAAVVSAPSAAQQFGTQQQQQQQQQQQPNTQQRGNAQQPVAANQNGAVQVMDTNQAVAAGIANVVQQPFADLSPEEQKYTDTVLNIWENRTSKIDTFECKFARYVYEATVDPSNPSTISQGFIRFKHPDKGVFKEDARSTLAGRKPDGSPDYKVDPKFPNGDWWVCDGEWVHNLNRNDKKAVRVQLPPELRGTNIPMSPLPFLFGVKAQEVKQRYFVRWLPSPPGNNDVWIEAWPKRADDAGNYSRVQVALDRNDSLPNAMILFMPNFAANNPNREVFNFSAREVNSNNLLDKIKEKVFMRAFIETEVGSDWVVEKEPWVPPQQNQFSPTTPQLTPGGQGIPQGQPSGRVASPPQTPPR